MRMTITLSEEGKNNLEKAQKIISKEFGGGKVTQGFAIGYALKTFVEEIEKEQNNNEDK
ncbi:hypothetical protein [Metasolibacillus meyeri]|uniref:hypothetical protein n=1 Tax=Metasolibacillus meyeri TaxID=1071052 RepID=UPI00187D4469|nr:hypothetical protein [Metasolibacillus meyeri]